MYQKRKCLVIHFFKAKLPINIPRMTAGRRYKAPLVDSEGIPDVTHWLIKRNPLMKTQYPASVLRSSFLSSMVFVRKATSKGPPMPKDVCNAPLPTGNI